MLYFLASPGQCHTSGATFMANSTVKTTGDDCRSISGSGSGSSLGDCRVDWCAGSQVVKGGLFLSRTGSCGKDRVGSVFIR